VKYAVEMASGAMIYIPGFIKISLGIQKLIKRIHSNETAYFYFFKIRKVG
jgi:hypothetical protein